MALAVLVLGAQLMHCFIPVEDVACKVRQHGVVLLASAAITAVMQRHFGADPFSLLPFEIDQEKAQDATEVKTAGHMRLYLSMQVCPLFMKLHLLPIGHHT